MSLVELVVRRFSDADVTEVRPHVFQIVLDTPIEAEDFEKVYDSREGFWSADEVNGCMIPIDPKTLLVGQLSTSPDFRYAQKRSVNRRLAREDFLVDPVSGTGVTDLLQACNDSEMLALIGERFRVEFVGRLRLESCEASVLAGESSIDVHLRDVVTPLFALLKGGETRYAVIPVSSAIDAHHAFIVHAALNERGILAGSLILVSNSPTNASFQKLEYVDPEDLSSAEVVETVNFQEADDAETAQIASFQANTVEHVFKIVDSLLEGPQTRSHLDSIMGIVPRQVSYYLDTAALLGLITKDDEKGSARRISLSASGLTLGHATGGDRAKLMLKSMSVYEPLKDAVQVMFRTGSLSQSRSCEIVRKYDPRLGKKTNERRSSALRSWTKWAFEQTHNYDINIESIF